MCMYVRHMHNQLGLLFDSLHKNLAWQTVTQRTSKKKKKLSKLENGRFCRDTCRYLHNGCLHRDGYLHRDGCLRRDGYLHRGWVLAQDNTVYSVQSSPYMQFSTYGSNVQHTREDYTVLQNHKSYYPLFLSKPTQTQIKIVKTSYTIIYKQMSCNASHLCSAHDIEVIPGIS